MKKIAACVLCLAFVYSFSGAGAESPDERKRSAQQEVDSAMQYYIQGHDIVAAAEGFKRAHLIDPGNAEALYGLGFIYSIEGNTDEAIGCYQKAIEASPKYAMAMCNLAREYINKASRAGSSGEKSVMHDYIKKALALYEESSLAMTQKDKMGYLYYHWAVALELAGDYAGAWEKIKLCKKYGNQAIEPGFIQELAGFMPEPK